MSTRKLTTYAVVELTLRVENLGNWGPECSVEQVHKQASEEAINKIARLIRGKDPMKNAVDGVKIVGVPKVEAVAVESKL